MLVCRIRDVAIHNANVTVRTFAIDLTGPIDDAVRQLRRLAGLLLDRAAFELSPQDCLGETVTRPCEAGDMYHFISSEPPHADVRLAMPADAEPLATAS